MSNVDVGGAIVDRFYVAWKHVLGSYRTYGAIMEIPLYESALRPLAIHFLPCREVKATTVCPIYGQPNYPVKGSLVLKEPVTCSI